MKPSRCVRVLTALLLVCSLGAQDTNAQNLTQPVTGAAVPCANGQAAGFDCSNVDLLSFLPISSITGHRTATSGLRASRHACHDEECGEGGAPGSVQLNDMWGWTDPQTGNEYAIVGRTEGAAFVDITDPVNPVYLGELPTHADTSGWRDMKVYENYAFVVADYNQNDPSYVEDHGMQVFDLTRLRNVQNPPELFTEDAHYGGFGNAHNLFINEETGFAYAVGSNTFGGGLHIVDIRDPLNPVFAGAFADSSTGFVRSAKGRTGYTHDVQCVVYTGPDTEHHGKEICLGSNESALSIADVTDKLNPVALSTATYRESRYAHQGWLTEDQRYFLMDDELDEADHDLDLPGTRTIIWDVSDLDNPQVWDEYFAPVKTRDHNQYVVGDFSYQANYQSGLRILDISGIDEKVFTQAGFFDTDPSPVQLSFDGAWSNYPFYESGVVAVSSIGQGLFVLKPDLSGTPPVEPPDLPKTFDLLPAGPNPFQSSTTFELTVAEVEDVTVAVYDVLGRQVALLHQGHVDPGILPLTFDAAGLPNGQYFIQARSESGVVTRVVTLVR